jgi:SCP-2 sterol transfer family
VADWLSEEWLQGLAELAGSRPPVPGISGTVSVAITIGRRDQVAYYWSYRDGVPGQGGVGTAADAQLILAAGNDDAASLMSGEVEPSVAYMRGRLKASGDGAMLLAWLESTATDQYRKWRSHAESVLGHPPRAQAPQS